MSPLAAPAHVRTRPVRPRPLPAPAPARRPRLRVVDEVVATRSTRSPHRGRIIAVATTVVAVISLFALAAFHAMLISGQVRLDGLASEVAKEQSRYESLRLEVATLESPERIVAAAQDQLGMVSPEEITWLPAPAPAADAVGATSSPDLTQVSWGAVKPLLGGTR